MRVQLRQDFLFYVPTLYLPIFTIVTLWWELLKQYTRQINIQHMITREVKTQNSCRPAFPPRHWWPRKPMEEGTNTYPGTHQQPPTHSFNNYGLQRPTKRMPCYFYYILIKIASLLVDHIRPEMFILYIFSTKWWPGEANAPKIIFSAFLVFFHIDTTYIK